MTAIQANEHGRPQGGGGGRVGAPPWKIPKNIFYYMGGLFATFSPCGSLFATFVSLLLLFGALFGSFSPCCGRSCYVFFLMGTLFTMRGAFISLLWVFLGLPLPHPPPPPSNDNFCGHPCQ